MSAAGTTIPCSGEEHDLEWRDGVLRVPGHAGVDAEQALGALGASPPRCLRVRSAWDVAVADPVLVTLGRRPGEADIGIGANPGPGARMVYADDPRRRDSFLLVFTLPAPMIDRAALTAAALAAEQWSDPVFRARHGLRLGAALASRATPALRRLGGALAGPDEPVVVHCTPAGHDESAVVMAERSEHGLEVTASIPVGWIASVWGPGLSEPDGHMVLSLQSVVTPDLLEVDVAEWRLDGVDQWEAAPRSASLARGANDEPWKVS